MGAIGFAAAYMAGYTRGELYGERTREITEFVQVDLPPDYAGACGVMMEAAWSALDDGYKPTDQEMADLLGR